MLFQLPTKLLFVDIIKGSEIRDLIECYFELNILSNSYHLSLGMFTYLHKNNNIAETRAFVSVLYQRPSGIGFIQKNSQLYFIEFPNRRLVLR